MKLIYVQKLLPILISFVSFSISAQDISEIDSVKLSRMKADGKLTGREQFTNRNAVSHNRSGIPTSPVVTPASTSCNCWITRDNTFQIGQFDASGGNGGPGLPPEYRNDDWSTALITLPFNVCFYGQTVNQIYLNNNGNISIGAPYSTFTALSFPDPTYVMIAPFWADVDTRALGSGLVYYSVTATHLIVQWENVGYFNIYDDKLNTFQLIVTDGTDPILPSGQNISFCYKDMQWTTGDASSGVNGFGGVPATVGVNQGNGVDYIQFGLFDQAGTTYDGPFGLNDGVDWLDNQSFTMNACISGSNIPPVLNALNVCDTIRLCENATHLLTANYLSPEQGEITNITFNANGMTGISMLTNTPGNTASIVLEIVASAANAGFHMITLVATDNGTPVGVTNNNIVLEIVPAPNPSFTYSPSSPMQVNTLVTFTNTTPPGSLLVWDFGDGSPTTTVPNPQHTYTTAGTYTVTLSATFPAGGCTTVVSQQIVVTQCIAPTITVSNVCANDASLITFTGTASSSAVFTWDFNGGTVLSGTGSGPYDVSWNTPGTYNVSLNVTESTCSLSVTEPVTINAIPLSSITPVAALCAGDISTVNFNGTAGVTSVFTWNFGGSTVVSGSGSGPYDLQWNTAGNDIVTLIVSENGCSDTSDVSVVINPIPTANFIVPPAACAGDVLNVSYTGSASASANYTWDFNSGVVLTGSGQGPYTVRWDNGGIYNVGLSVTENGCQSAPVSMPVDVTPLPVITFSAIPTLCAGQTDNINFTGTAGVNAAYQWNFGNGIVLSGSGPGPYSVQWNNAGQVQVLLTVIENGCSASNNIDILVNPIPTSDFVVNNSACINQPVTLNYTGTAGATANYNWSFTSGTVISGSGPGPYTIVWNTTGTYPISLIVDDNGCISPPTNLNAVVFGLPVANAGTDQQGCSGTIAPLGGPPVPGEIYQWNPQTNLSNPSASNPDATLSNLSGSVQQDFYILTVTDNNGCINYDTVIVSSIPEPVVNFVSPQPQCIKNNNFSLAALSNIQSGVNYTWTFTPQATPSSTIQATLTATYSAVGTYPVVLAGDFNGCPSQPFVDSVTIYEMPSSDFLPLVFEGCEPLTVPFNNMSVGDGNTYNWNFGDGYTDNTGVPVHVFQSAGVYTVSLSATNIHGCTVDTTYKDLISVFPTPGGNFIPNPQVANILSPVIQFQNHSSYANYYSWNFGDSDTSTVWSPVHTYGDTGSFTVTLMVMSIHGCVDTVHGVVRIEDNFFFYVPNAFSPNGDGYNDVFNGFGYNIRSYKMNIYDRWGLLIYTTDKYDKPWDGKMNSGMVQNDVFVYRIELTDHHDTVHTYVGNVTVVK